MQTKTKKRLLPSTRKAIIKITSIVEDVEKSEPLWITDGNVKQCSCYRTVWQFLKKLNMTTHGCVCMCIYIYIQRNWKWWLEQIVVTNVHGTISHSRQKTRTNTGASLVDQWWNLPASTEESLIHDDSTCRGATKPWHPRACMLQQEKPPR